MIASQKIGKSFMGALNYNLKKLYHPDENLRAELLDTNFSSLDTGQIRKEIDWLCSLKPNLGRYVYHTSLNFPVEDAAKLDNGKLLAIAHRYLKENGYTNNQFFVFRHHDADHPHLHVLANRICFDGTVVEDSNNYYKSEAILRKLELQYGLTVVKHSRYKAVRPDSRTETGSNGRKATVPNGRNAMEPGGTKATWRDGNVSTGLYSDIAIEPGSYISQRAPTKNELEMVLRTGKASGKMVLQELLSGLLQNNGQPFTLSNFINKGEQAGIRFLFNQASTGRITGITYYYGNFKSTGKALGNRYKWSEIIKHIGYEQIRDGQAARQANDRTTKQYGLEHREAATSAAARNADANTTTATQQQKDERRSQREGSDAANGSPVAGQRDSRNQVHPGDGRTAASAVAESKPNREDPNGAGGGTPAADVDYENMDSGTGYSSHHYPDPLTIQIADDVDDELHKRRKRKR
ncbi:relaxase/mobilization nuclease domain-containing protein [Mucilaginibacter sp.]